MIKSEIDHNLAFIRGDSHFTFFVRASLNTEQRNHDPHRGTTCTFVSACRRRIELEMVQFSRVPRVHSASFD